MCPEAVREAAELSSRMKPPKVQGMPTRPALRENLLLMAKQDQEARSFLRSSGLPIDATRPEIVRMREVDSANLARLKHIVHQDGFPTAVMVGIDGVECGMAAGDPCGQRPGLSGNRAEADYRARASREIHSDQVAMLTDDLLAGRGKPQRYGTNFELRDGELKPAPMEDEANIERTPASGWARHP